MNTDIEFNSEKKDPKVSIIVPVYNVEKYIERCIVSTINQSMKDWELIMVDDFSRDHTMDIIRKYAKVDNRIRFIESNKNVGPMVARSKGYQIAKGNYLTFLDGDDSLPVNALEILYDTAIKTKADIAAGNIIRISEAGNQQKFGYCCYNRIWNRKEIIIELLKNEFPHNLCGKIFKSDLFQNKNLENYTGFTHGEDGLLFYQVLENIEVVATTDMVVYNYWMIESSSTHKKVKESIVNNAAFFAKYRHDFFQREGVNFEEDFYKAIYYKASIFSHDMPYRKIRSIFSQHGIELNVSVINILKYYSFVRMIKLYYDLFVYRHSIYIISIIKRLCTKKKI